LAKGRMPFDQSPLHQMVELALGEAKCLSCIAGTVEKLGDWLTFFGHGYLDFDLVPVDICPIQNSMTT
jgi:hypothetical protein